MPRTKRNFTLIETAVENQGQRGAVSTRLMLGRYFAEIMADQDHSVFHWVVQPEGSAEILQLGQELSFAHALERAHECLEGLDGRNESKSLGRTVFYEFGKMQ